MNVLEKILGEIKARKEEWSKSVPTEYEKNVCQGIEIAEEIVEEHLKCNGWIPVEERLPDESGIYIVTVNDGCRMRSTYMKYYKTQRRWELTGTRAYWRVFAWMLLPEPYKEKKTE